MRQRLWNALTVVETVGAITVLAALGTAWACGVAAARAFDRAVNGGR